MPPEQLQPHENRVQENRYYYSCWPFPWGGWLCGVSLIVIGAGMFLQRFYPGSEELVWGALLIALGAVVLLAAARRGDGDCQP